MYLSKTTKDLYDAYFRGMAILETRKIISFDQHLFCDFQKKKNERKYVLKFLT